MGKRPMIYLALGFLLGLLFGASFKVELLMIGMGLLAVPFFFHGEGERKRYKCILDLLILLAFLAGTIRMHQAIVFRENSLGAFWQEEAFYTRVQGEVERKENKNGSYTYYLSNCSYTYEDVSISCNQILLYIEEDTYKIGQILVLEGKLYLFEAARNEGNFDARTYYSCNGIDFYMKKPRVASVEGKEHKLKEALYLLRLRMRQVYVEAMSEEDAGVMSTMVLGDRSILLEEVKELYQEIGISHILAISGLHVSLLGLSIYHLLRKMSLRYVGATIGAGTVISLYGILTNAGPTTKRAILMLFMVMLADCLGRAPDLLSNLSFVFCLLLWKQPFYIGYSGFVFSFLAVFGAGVTGRILIRYMGNLHGLSKRKTALVMNLGIWATTLWFLAYVYYEIPSYSIICNLLLVPFAGILLTLGLLGGGLGLWAPGLCKIPFAICHLLLSYYHKIGSMLVSLGHSSMITGRPSEGRILLYMVLFFAGLLWFYFHTKEDNKESYLKWMRLSAWLFLLLIVLVFPQKLQNQICFLDVGQGDGIFLASGHGDYIMIDGGSTSLTKVGSKRILPFLKYKGVKAIDYWIVSHPDEDHVSGLLEALEEGYPVRHILVSAFWEKDEILREIMYLAEANQIEVIYVRAGDELRLREGKLCFLLPDASYAKGKTDLNDLSLAIYYEENNFSAMLCGDLTKTGENHLLQKGLLGKVDLYKVNHHGSDTSSSKEFLEIIKPELSVISCGLNNVYGHPAKAVVNRLEEIKTDIYQTKDQGEIQILLSKDGGYMVQCLYENN